MMSLAECENETTAPADWAIWTPFTLVGSWEIGLSEIASKAPEGSVELARRLASRPPHIGPHKLFSSQCDR